MKRTAPWSPGPPFFAANPAAGALSLLAAALLILSPAAASAGERVITLATDFQSAGSLAATETAPPWETDADLTLVHSDCTARVHGGLIYVVNKLGADNVQVVDPAADFATLIQFSVGAGTNPQDIAVVTPERAYVSRYETNDLLEVDPQTGEHLGTVSLADFADADGLCEMHRMHIDGGFLYIQIQRMLRQDWPDPWIPAPPSLLAVLDLDHGELVDVDPDEPGIQGIALQGLNPVAPMQVEPETGDLLVPEAGQYAVIDAGGVERVDLDAWESNGFSITETQLGGDVVDFAPWSPSKAFALISDAEFNTKVLAYDPAGGGTLDTVYDPGGYVLVDLLPASSGYLFVGDRDFVNPGLRVFDCETHDLLAGPISTGPPPFELILLPDGVSDAPGFPSVQQLGLPYPNPATVGVRLRWNADHAPRKCEVFDAAGRSVRTWRGASGMAGGELFWDGRDAGGRSVAAGLYLIRVTLRDGAELTRRVHMIR
ncbi:MAG: hypothetical protein GF355_04930 [Candidatus Eisenbacteria bacterium]|nr:hypothetical protein [Candidatus Eisenbacteria bacterium]